MFICLGNRIINSDFIISVETHENEALIGGKLEDIYSITIELSTKDKRKGPNKILVERFSSYDHMQMALGHIRQALLK